MRWMKTLLIAFALVAGMSVVSVAQDWDHDRDRDRDYRYNGYYGNYGYVDPIGSARHYGFEDGLTDGRNDRAVGNPYRLGKDSNYKHADRGYIKAYGDKNQYRAWYRQAYEHGYQRGYGSGGYYGRSWRGR